MSPPSAVYLPFTIIYDNVIVCTGLLQHLINKVSLSHYYKARVFIARRRAERRDEIMTDR